MNYNELKYVWLLFDLDNTLFDHEKTEYESLKATFVKFGIQFSKEILVNYKFIENSLWDSLNAGKIHLSGIPTKRFSLLIKKMDLSLDPKHISEAYLSNYRKNIYLISGALSTLKKLHKYYNIAIICNGLKLQKDRIKSSKISNYIHAIILSEEIGVNKPDRLFFQFTLNIINYYQKEKILIIGDSLDSDIKGGMNFGIDTCWLRRDEQSRGNLYRPTYEISCLKELLNILL